VGGRSQRQADMKPARLSADEAASSFDLDEFLRLIGEKVASVTAENFLLRSQMPIFQRFHEGGIVQGPPGAEVPIIARVGEEILREDQRGTNVTVIVEDDAVDKNKIKVVVDDRLSQHVRSARRMTAVPGRRGG